MFSCCKSRRRNMSSASTGTSRFSRRKRILEDHYELQQQLGEGKTGQVFLAKKRKQGIEVAVKFVRHAYLNTPNRQDAFNAEMEILGMVKHANAVKLIEIFEDSNGFAIVTERAAGGEILEVICRNPEFKLKERDIVFVIRQLLDVLKYLHSRGITHRDVKVENLLCKTDNLRDGIVLIDFGLAHHRKFAPEMTGMNGTPHYMAPEMFGKNSHYGPEIDLWAVGIVTYVLLFGRYPFDAKFMSQVEDKIISGVYEIPQALASSVSRQAVKFIEYLLVTNPRERPPAGLALQHPWLQDTDSNNERDIEFSDAHMAQIRSFIDGKKIFNSQPSGIPPYEPPAPVI